MNYSSAKAKRDALLGQRGPHKKKNYLDELSRPENIKKNEELSRAGKPSDIFKEVGTQEGGFLIKDRAAIEASKTIALEQKPFGKKNPHIREPTGYDPDYMPPELRELQDQKLKKRLVSASADDIFNNILKDDDEILSELKNQSAYREPSLINYIFGSKGKPGRLHWRLANILKRKRRQREIPNSLLDKRAENPSTEDVADELNESLNTKKSARNCTQKLRLF